MDNMIYEKLIKVPEDYVEHHFQRTFNALSSDEVKCLKKIIQRFVAFIPSTLSDEKKAGLLYEVITSEISYSYNADNESQFVFVAALLKGKAVCMGIAELYAVLCFELGIPCEIVIGYAWNGTLRNGELHAWNLIKVEDNGEKKWFHCDPTWDLKELNHKKRYFMKTDEYMKNNRHIWLQERYPKCDAETDTISLNEEGVKLLCRILRKEIASALREKG